MIKISFVPKNPVALRLAQMLLDRLVEEYRCQYFALHSIPADRILAQGYIERNKQEIATRVRAVTAPILFASVYEGIEAQQIVPPYVQDAINIVLKKLEATLTVSEPLL